MIIKRILCLLIWMLLIGCNEQPLNSPYPHLDPEKKVLFTSFSEQPKTLDPAKAYSSNEYTFISQIYEPLLQYHYLKRPYQLQPQTITSMPEVNYLDKSGRKHRKLISDVVATEYIFELKKGVFYQPHPAFVKNAKGKYLYHHLTEEFLEKNAIESLHDFKKTATRELTAHDYAYQIKRLADPRRNSPIASLMSTYIIGFQTFSKEIRNQLEHHQKVNLRALPMKGIKVLDKYKFKITIHGYYPQFSYWLAMPFFAPMPWEAQAFYKSNAMSDRNITLAWYPIGTGPFMLEENNPNRKMVMVKNPNYHGAYFPSKGTQSDFKHGYLLNAGKKLPLLDKVVFTLEKESIPRWNKFMQGYYDSSGVSSDSFDQAITVNRSGEPILTPVMKEKKIRLQSSVEPSIFYMGFNMLDDVVGGLSEKKRKLRHAISIVVNYEEYISIFLNGRGLVAQGPLPPGISGYRSGQEGLNNYVYDWFHGKAKRKSLEQAKKLLVQAGYPNGRDEKTGKPLILNFDVAAGAGPEEKAYFSWLRKEFKQINIALNIRATQYNRFQEKMRTGKAQIFTWGWNADYPDPENFLFLFLGKNSKVKGGGENAANYTNPAFDRLYKKMVKLPDGERRNKLIYRMVSILQKDAPWIWGLYPKQFVLQQHWVSPIKPNPIGNSTMRYMAVNGHERVLAQERWNQPVLWPIGLIFLLVILAIIPVVINYHRKMHRPKQRRINDKLSD